MLTLALVSLAAPALVGTILFLLPRSPWVAVGPAVQAGRRVVPGTAALALGGSFALSIWLQEGPTAAWSPWHTLPLLIGGFGVVALARGSHERPTNGVIGCLSAPFMALVAGLLVFFMQFPGWTLADRALAALAAVPLTLLLCPSIGAAPVTTTIVGAVACGGMASLCLASGFAKLAMALLAAASVLGVMATACACNRRLTPGVGTVTLLSALLVGSAAAGHAHDFDTFPTQWWWVVALAPVAPIITVPLVGTASRSGTAALVKVAVVVLLCGLASYTAWSAANRGS